MILCSILPLQCTGSTWKVLNTIFHPSADACIMNDSNRIRTKLPGASSVLCSCKPSWVCSLDTYANVPIWCQLWYRNLLRICAQGWISSQFKANMQRDEPWVLYVVPSMSVVFFLLPSEQIGPCALWLAAWNYSVACVNACDFLVHILSARCYPWTRNLESSGCLFCGFCAGECHLDRIYGKKDYWREDLNKETFYSCQPGLCLAETGEQSTPCRPGHEGILCGICSEG